MEWLHIALIGVLIVIALVAARLLNFLGRGADAGHSRAARERADGYGLGGYMRFMRNPIYLLAMG